MSINKRYYDERIEELKNDIKEWAEEYTVKFIRLADEAKEANIKLAQKINEMTRRKNADEVKESEAVEAFREAVQTNEPENKPETKDSPSVKSKNKK